MPKFSLILPYLAKLAVFMNFFVLGIGKNILTFKCQLKPPLDILDSDCQNTNNCQLCHCTNYQMQFPED